MSDTVTVTLDRTYLAPPERVWAAWADVDLLTKWWGCAADMLWNVHAWDFRVGGDVHVSMDFDGTPYEVRGRFTDLEPHRLIRYSWEGGQVITVTIEPDGDGSRMTIEHAGLPDEQMGEIVTGGWSASVEQILAVLS